MARNPDLSRARDDDSGDAPDGCGLARAVRADQPKDLTGANLKAEPLDGWEVTIQLLQSIDFDHGQLRGCR
jgi:hypothetical protein